MFTSSHGGVCLHKHPHIRGRYLCCHPLQLAQPSSRRPSMSGFSRESGFPAMPRPREPPTGPQALSCEVAPPFVDLLYSTSHLRQALHPTCEVLLHLQLHMHAALHPALAMHLRCHIVLSGTRHQDQVLLFTAVDPHQKLLTTTHHSPPGPARHT